MKTFNELFQNNKFQLSRKFDFDAIAKIVISLQRVHAKIVISFSCIKEFQLLSMLYVTSRTHNVVSKKIYRWLLKDKNMQSQM